MIFGRIIEQVNTKFGLSIYVDLFGKKGGNSYFMQLLENLGPVVQSIVSLTSSLRGQHVKFLQLYY